MLRRFALPALLFFGALACAQLANSPTSAGNYLDVGGMRLWYEECGSRSSAPGLVLLHDGLVHSVTWDSLWAPLCAKYHVVRYDRRGYGRSEPAKLPFVPEDDLLKIMRQARMEHAILVGNSSGGGLALDFALAHPEKVAGLFLIGPVVHGMASTDYFNERGNRNNDPLARGDVNAAVRNWSQDRFLISGDDLEARKRLYEVLAKNPQNLTINGGLETRPSPPTATRLSEIRVPTLVVVGEADIADVFAYAGAIVAALPLASFEVWKDAGHLIQLQRPAELLARFNRYYSLATREEKSLPEAQLADYIGTYACFDRPDSMSIKEHRLVFEIPGEPYYWLFAASESAFFMRTEETEIQFQRDTAGKVKEMVVHNSDGNIFHCRRL